MKLLTHLVFGILVGLMAELLIGSESLLYKFLFILALVFGALLPDADYSINWLLKKLHRGVLHSLWLAIVVGFAAYYLFEFLALPLVIGILVHLLLDSLTPQGVKLLYPWLRVKGNIQTGSAREYVIMLVGLVFVVILAVYSV